MSGSTNSAYERMVDGQQPKQETAAAENECEGVICGGLISLIVRTIPYTPMFVPSIVQSSTSVTAACWAGVGCAVVATTLDYVRYCMGSIKIPFKARPPTVIAYAQN